MDTPNAPRDYREETHLHRSALVRGLLIACGSVCLALGVLGIFLPLLPTTPFLLLAAACYARGSVRFYNWLMNHRYFGSYLRMWREHRAIPKRAKLLAVALICVTIGSSVLFFIPLWPVKLLLLAIGACVIVYLLRLPTLPVSEEPSSDGSMEGR